MTDDLAVKVINGITLADDPARESCFTVAQNDDEMMNFPNMDCEESRRERLHRHMNNELVALEIAAQSLFDFPDEPWELRMEMARQAYDESRHVQGLYSRLRELGGHKGEFPIGNFEWSVTMMQDSLVARLAIQNRTFEAGEMDLLGGLRKVWRDLGDVKTAELLESILADEISHVRYANRWIKKKVSEDGRGLLKIAQAMCLLSEANEAIAPPIEGKGAKVNIAVAEYQRLGINEEDRRIAEFTDDEINEILQQAGMRSLTEIDTPGI